MRVNRTVYRIENSKANEGAAQRAVGLVVKDFGFRKAPERTAYPGSLAAYTLQDTSSGEPLKLAIAVERALWAFGAEDILDLESVAGRLKRPSPSDQVSGYVRTNLSAATDELLSNYHGGPDSRLQTALAADLNALICRAYAKPVGELLYTPKRFARVELSPEAVELLTKQVNGPALVHLNRLLLQDAFPSEIAKTRQRDRIRVDLSQRRGETATYLEVQTRLTWALKHEVGDAVELEKQRYRLP